MYDLSLEEDLEEKEAADSFRQWNLFKVKSDPAILPKITSGNFVDIVVDGDGRQPYDDATYSYCAQSRIRCGP